MADHRLAGNVGVGEVAEADAVEDVLAGRQVLQQHLGGEITLRQRGDRRQGAGILELLGGRHLDQHLGGPVGARPDHAAVAAGVARLHAVGDQRPVRGARQIGRGEQARACRCGGGEEASAGQSERHGCLS
jgi:hypothetical protein